jgi:hypothetical protein
MTETTFYVNVSADRMDVCDGAIIAYMMTNPDSSVDDALDAIFNVGMNVVIAINPTFQNNQPDEVCIC